MIKINKDGEIRKWKEKKNQRGFMREYISILKEILKEKKKNNNKKYDRCQWIWWWERKKKGCDWWIREGMEEKKMVSVLVIKTFESNFGTNSKILLMNK